MSTFVIATANDILNTLEKQNFNFTSDQINSRLITVSRPRGEKTARVYRPAVAMCLAVIDNLKLTTSQRSRLKEGLNKFKFANRGRPKLTKERLTNSAPREYTVQRNGMVYVPVAAFLQLTGGEHKVAVHYNANGVLITKL